jgi:hypothetical protein
MSNVDYRGARGANAGDYFHELWAVRHALSLLDHDSELTVLTVEGLRPEDEEAQSQRNWEGVDCGLYYGATAVKESKRVEIEQLKYSSADPEKPWTIARLTSSTGKKVNNSVMRRLADAFHGVETARGSSDGIVIRLVSNQPMAADVVEILKAATKDGGSTQSSEAKKDLNRIIEATGLSGESLRTFVESLDLSSQTGSRFALEENVLKTIATWTDDDARVIRNTMMQFVAQKMLPESKGDFITRENVLVQFGFSSKRALFPCPSEIRSVSNPVRREVASTVVREMRDGKKFICLHGPGGCGKTTALQEIESEMPQGSTMIVFDCYGAGRYLDSDAYRHRPKDAFLQLSNDVATRLRVPLLLTYSKDIDYPRSLGTRLNRAAEILGSNNKAALLVLAVDAADNSVTAANSVTPPERSFVHDFVNFGSLPDNVRFLVTARTGRLDQLKLPTRFHRVPLEGFTRDETRSNISRIWTSVPDAWVDDFHHLSGGNPRVQSYALEYGNRDLTATLNYLRPGGKDLKQVFNQRLEEALLKSGGSATVDAFCAALVVLPRPIPREELAAISNLTIAQVNDICADLSPAIRTSAGSVGFADEDFEHFIRDRVVDLDSARARVAERFLARHEIDGYAAAHLAPALHQARRGKEIIQLLETQPAPAAIQDPLMRREVQLQRIRTAVQAANEHEDVAGALRTILIGAEALKTDAAIRGVVRANPDLAAAFMLESASKMILQNSNEVQHHGPLLFHRLRENAAAKSGIMAREDYRQLRAWIDRRGEDLARKKAEHPGWRHPDAWEIGDRDVAAEVEATILLYGPEAALADLGRWKPRQLHLRVAQILVPRLLMSGHADLVEKCIAENLLSPPWDLALLVPLAVSGRTVDVSRFENSISRLHRYLRLFRLHRLGNEWTPGLASYWFDTIMTACEIVVAHGGSRERIRPVLTAFADPQFRRIDPLRVSQASLLDVLLRAHALLEEDAGRSISVDSFVTESDSANLADNPTAPREKSEDRERHEEVRRTVGSLVPIYRTRAEILLGKVTAETADKSLAQAAGAFLHDSRQFARRLGARELRKRATLSVANLIFVPKLNPLMVLERSLSVFENHVDPYGSDETAVLSVVALNKSSHEKVLTVIVERAESVSTMRAAAREKIDAMLNLARFLDPISRSDAKALFGRAHSMTEELDSEAIFLLKSMATLCIRAKTALQDEACRSAAGGFGAVVTDAAIRLSGQEGFPWHSVATGLATLCLPVALSAIARWEDTCVGDWELCLRAALETALSERTINSEEVAALLALVDHPQKELVAPTVNGLDVGEVQRARAVLDTLAKDELLRFGRGRREDVLRILSSSRLQSTDIGSWFVHLQKTSQFVSDLGTRNSESTASRMTEEVSPEAITQILLTMPGQQVTAAGITATLKAVRQAVNKTVPYVSAQQVFEQVRNTISVNERIPHLQALIELSGVEASENEVAVAINAGLTEWASPGVKDWCREQLPRFLSRQLPGLARWLVFEREAPIRSMVTFLAHENENIPKILIEGIASHVDDLGAEPVYAVVSLMAEYLNEQVAAAVVQHYLPRCLARIPKKDLDPLALDDIPSSPTLALARFLFALLSDCDVRIRWRIAHVLRRLAQFGQTPLLHSVLDLYDRTAEPSFRAPKTPFYWISARLWTLIAVDRIAAENPQTLAAYGNRLLGIACDDAFPHVLIRGFAKDAVQKLSKRGVLSLDGKQQKALKQVNLGKGTKKRVFGRGGEVGASHSRRKGGFHFDSLDTLPYWYEPATRIFADVTMDEFTRTAENWIVTQWGVSTEIQRWKDEPRPERFPEGRWALWSNDHGNRPTLERYFTYLEWHGMWCAVGTLLQSRPLASVEPGDYSSFENWLRGERLTRPPFWLSDLRASKPLERQLWSAPESAAWLAAVDNEDFLREIGIGVASNETIIVDAHHTTYASDFRSQVTVRSALVQPETAGALMRALQTTEEPYRYWIPYDRDRDGGQVDEPPYRLLGWIGLSESDSGLDKSDPERNQVSGNHCKPGREAERGLTKRVSSDGIIEWLGHASTVEYSYRQWSDSNDDDEESRSRITRSNGSRLYVTIDNLRTHLRRIGLDLLVKVELDRKKGDRYAGVREEETAETRFDRIVLLRRDGTIESAEGPLGTWYASRP